LKLINPKIDIQDNLTIDLTPQEAKQLIAMKEKAMGKDGSLKRNILIDVYLGVNSKTARQRDTVHALVRLIWQCENPKEEVGRECPTKHEHNDLYDELKNAYGFTRQTVVKFNGVDVQRDVVIGLSEMNSSQASIFIHRIFEHAAHITGRPEYVDRGLSSMWCAVREYAGSMRSDPLDYEDDGITTISEHDFRALHKQSHASGKTGVLHLHHIMSRGSSGIATHKSWNWVMLTHDEHAIVHSRGNDEFLSLYPSLIGRFKQAKKKTQEIEAGKNG
jgi:hypothetical protein